ncbi:MAG: hypothetical protein R2912_07660 [Eubacteriales bacterium]
MGELYESVSDKLDQLYGKLIKIRIRMAKKLDLPDYTTLGYLNMHRADYGPAEVARFREQVRTVIVPAVAKLREAQAKRLGVEKLKFYDETCIFPDGNADPIGGERARTRGAKRMVRHLAGNRRILRLFIRAWPVRPGNTSRQAPRGYCTYLLGL